MTKKFSLSAEKRSDGEKPGAIGRNGFIPGIIYGDGKPNLAVKVNRLKLANAYESAGESSLIDLAVGADGAEKVIIKSVQRDHLKGSIRHVDFFRVNMKKPIEVEIPINFSGTGKAIKDLGAMILTNLETIRAKCLPNDLLENIEVSLDSLKTVDDAVYVKDLAVPKTIEVLNEPDELVVNVSLARQEAEPEPAPAPEEAKKEEATAKGEAKTAGQEAGAKPAKK